MGRQAHAYQVATIYAGLKNADEAFRWPEAAYEQRDGFLPWVKTDPNMDSIRSNPRCSLGSSVD
jgi:hypothetical protein